MRSVISAIWLDALKGIQSVHKATSRSDVPAATRYMVHLRASQINGCSFCAEMHSRELREAGESDERIFTVAAWREAPYFTAGRAGDHRVAHPSQ